MTGWLTIADWANKPPLQVVPDDSLRPAHVLNDGCWCKPKRDAVDPRLLIHRQVLDA